MHLNLRYIPQLNWWQWALVVILALVGVQQFVPGDMLSLRARLDGKRPPSLRVSALQNTLQSQKLRYNLAIGSDQLAVDASAAGITTDVDKTLSQFKTISLVERLVPLGVVFYLAKPVDTQTVTTIDQVKLSQFAADTAKTYTRPPQDATAMLADGSLHITPAKLGQQVDPSDIQTTLRSAAATPSAPLAIKSTPLQPAITVQNFAAAQTTYAGAKDKKLIVSYGEITKTYSFEEVSKWLEIVHDDAGTWRIQIKRSTFDAQSVEWGKQFNQAAGVTQVTLVDDVETARIVGATGRRINEDKSYALLNAWLASPSAAPQQLVSDTISPTVAYTRIYTKTSAQLQAKLDAWIASHDGSYQVAIQELGGKGRTASHAVQQQTVMASTYKLFVAYAAYHQAENGALDLSASVLGGQSIEQCLSKAIIYSDNDCAIAVGKYIGWANIDNIIHAAGFKNVSLNNYDSSGNISGDKQVNANELARFLAQLSAGSLMNGSNTAHLLGYMKQQVYRDGIPAGSGGSVVADKVGFLDDFLHDAAIVYAPGSTYALVIMSSGSSWSNISNLASAVYSFMAE